MAVSDGKGAGTQLIATIGNPVSLLIAAAIALPAIAVTLVLVIWAITAT